MKTRIVAGGVAALAIIALIFFGPVSLMTTVVLLCAIVAYLEFDRLFFEVDSLARQMGMSVLILLALLALQYDLTASCFFLWIGFAAICVSHLFASSQEEDFSGRVRRLSLQILGFFYIVSLFGFLVPVVIANPSGRQYLFLLFLLVFLGDTAAYFVGSRFGKRKLAPFISPKKTVEGAVAALLLSFVIVVVWLLAMGRLVDADYATKLIVFAPIVSILAQLGDLFESVLKRSQAKKDSGKFLPGHGGILDRIDGLAFATPAFYLFLVYIVERAH